MEDNYGQIRVLHVLGGLGVGGAECRIMDLYRNMNRDRVQFDFLVHYSPDKTGKKSPTSDELMAVREPDYFDNTVYSLGGRIFCLPKFVGTNLLDYKAAIKKFFNEHRDEWKVVQGHMTSTAAIYLPIAKKAGIPILVAHARSAGVDKGVKGVATNFLRTPLRKEGITDYNFACSKEAGIAVFGNTLMEKGKVKIIPNAIDLKNFAYDEEKRNKIRKELGVSNAVVIGHVGSFRYAKNHEFLLQVFFGICKMLENDADNKYCMLHGIRMKLLMLGTGPLMDDMKKLADRLGIYDKCIFAGNKSNAADYYQAMDYFCFPSRYEGLPGSVIEAQAAGLQCVVSDSVTPEVDVTELVTMMSINDDPKKWSKKILDDLILDDNDSDDEADAGYESLVATGNSAGGCSLGDREGTSDYILNKLRDAGFDVKLQAKQMAYFYERGNF